MDMLKRSSTLLISFMDQPLQTADSRCITILINFNSTAHILTLHPRYGLVLGIGIWYGSDQYFIPAVHKTKNTYNKDRILERGSLSMKRFLNRLSKALIRIEK